MHKTIVKVLIVAPALLFVAASTACSSQKTVSQPLDTSTAALHQVDLDTATLEQVLNRTRLAMGDVVTYKTRGTIVDRVSGEEFSAPIRNFAEFHSYDRYKFGSDYSEYGGGQFVEWLSVGSQHFTRNSRHGWQEALEPSSEPRTPVPPSQGFLSFLYQDGIELVSTDEVTEDGVKVYRLGSTEKVEHFWSGDPVSETRTVSLLIDKESFRIVTTIIDKNYTRNIVDATDSEPSTKSDRWQMVYTEHYYDYNEPVVIEVPDDYIPWPDVAVLSSLLGS
ncbi:MAG: hypothetical protein IH867_04270 [Chloroflexi bacterium]|nr:hypothetical protein [Chloroflexota bacterium]